MPKIQYQLELKEKKACKETALIHSSETNFLGGQQVLKLHYTQKENIVLIAPCDKQKGERGFGGCFLKHYSR